MRDYEDELKRELGKLENEHALRSLKAFETQGLKLRFDGRELLNFSSNDYLGLSTEPSVIEAAIQATREYGTGGLSSRLVSGHSALCESLEQELADFKKNEAALVFPNGYSANLGIVSAFFSSETVFFMDRLCHASLIDAVKAGGQTFHRFRHNDLEHLEKLLVAEKKSGDFVILSESVFSMEGDLAPLEDLIQLAKKYTARLYVDEAHATGVFGECGEGLSARAGLGKEGVLQPGQSLVMGTFGKALGNYGAYFSGTVLQKKWLVNKSRPFIYTTALPPGVLGGIRGALSFLKSRPGLGKELLEKSERFRKRLESEGFSLIHTDSQILSILTGDNETTLELSVWLFEKGFLCAAIRPPTVEPGRARIRLTICRGHGDEDFERLVVALKAFRERPGK